MYTHTALIVKHGKKRLKVYKASKNWHCENGGIFCPEWGTLKNGNRKGWMDLDSLKVIKNG
ncbi:hypothetical protein AH03_56 [Erwinia phage AH03]|uniref:Uncharacterized protein n=1 Tax=Erwinia phage AH03 TaxID=2869568 RepID=A0AAE8BPZ6_9CAUD|nr:hypothetical protein AH03_56 [Erwinia phage AH03]